MFPFYGAKLITSDLKCRKELPNLLEIAVTGAKREFEFDRVPNAVSGQAVSAVDGTIKRDGGDGGITCKSRPPTLIPLLHNVNVIELTI